MKNRRHLLAIISALVITLPNAIGGVLNFADYPLSLKNNVPPNVLFALSVEFPTAISKAYGGAYSPDNEYLGYFDPDKCYSYVANPAADPATTNKGWFEPAARTTADNALGVHRCASAWSGNFLNWTSMTGLDEFRFAMTGGHRYLDTASVTVLERAYNDDWSNNTTYFPTKTYSGSGAHPFNSGVTLTIENAKKGHQMNVAFGGTDTASCTNPSVSAGTFSCTPALGGGNAMTGTCNSWNGNGTSTSPYQCTSMTFGSLGTFTVSANTLATSGSSSAVGSVSNETITCANPGPTNTAVTSSNFGCVLKDTANNSRVCTAWGGQGTVASPFICNNWQVFAGEQFVASPTPPVAIGTFTSTYTTTGTGSANNKTCTVQRCVSSSNSQVCFACDNVTGTDDFSCQMARPGSSGTYSCTGSWATNGTQTGITAVRSGNNKVTLDNRDYYNRYDFSWNTSATTTSTYSYYTSYAGSDSTVGAYYYYPSYTITYGGTSIDYFVRAKVCASGMLESNCQLQADGTTYKPTGVVQDKSEIMRFGVFSYFNSPNIDNAVMRSRLKHVGPNKYATGGSVTNAAKEWDTSGILIKNPDSADATASKAGAVANSGVINYVNKFGTTGTGAYRYKQYDPVGKLYYESLRYLRNLGPTDAFSKDVTSTNNDNFPVITDWYNSSRELERYSCQKNYIITMGDKNTHCDKRLPGGTLTNSSAQCNASANGTTQLEDSLSLGGDTVNVTTETNYVGAREGLGNIGGVKTGSGSAGSYYMAGLAAWAASNNIRKDKTDADWVAAKPRVKTFVLNVEEGGNCSYQSQFWLTAKYGDPVAYDDGGNATAAGTWKNPLTDGPLVDTNSIWSKPLDILANSCTGGLPTGFDKATDNTNVPWPAGLLRGGDPARMIASVKSAIDEIANQVGTESALAQSSGDLRTSQVGAFIYRAIFDSQGWTGDVQAYQVFPNGDLAALPAWKATEKLPAWGDRKVFTFNDGLIRNTDGTITSETTTNARKGVTFSSSNFANLSSLQKYLLNRDEAGVSDPTGAERGPDRVSYLRGDDSKDSAHTTGYGWRKRTTPIGDFINSNPVYVGNPNPGIVGKDNAATGYFYDFAKDVVTAGRTPMVYSGANDGMLHGFEASVDSTTGLPTTVAGTERIAYVPSAVYSNLSLLMSPTYGHKYFVDGSPTSSEACFGACDSKTKWKTLLVGGLNAGGQGLYALDITNPLDFSTAAATDVVLWEFTDKDDKHLGNTFGRPEIRLMNNNKWAVISGNGYNNTVNDGNFSDTGRAYMYVLFVDGPGGGNAWVKDTHYIRIELKSPTESAANRPNGIAYIAPVDKDRDGKADYIYAGDLNGNLWKIDVRDSNPTNWKSSFGTVADPLPLFAANDGATTPTAQRITGGLEVSKHPNGGYLVTFGTGQFLEIGDTSTTSQDSFYGIWDKDDGTRVTNRTSLQKQKVAAELVYNGTSYFFMTQCTPNYSTGIVASNLVVASDTTNGCPSDIAFTNSGQQLGWVIDFPNSGERYVNDRPRLEAGLLTLSTLQPNTNPCTGNTNGREYNLNYLTGGAPSSDVFDLNSSGSITSADRIGVTIDGVAVNRPPTGKQYSGGSSDSPVRFQLDSGGSTGGSGTAPSCSVPFVPGWGCPPRMKRSTTNCSKWVEDVVSAEFSKDKWATSGLTGTKKCLTAPSGRLNWRQIVR